jgi:hypothetical protein
MTVSGPYGQYTVEAVVDAASTFSSVPTPALIEMGIQPVRVVRLRRPDGSLEFKQLGRALTSVAGVEDLAPVLFGEPGAPAIIGSVTLAILLLEADAVEQKVIQAEGTAGQTAGTQGAVL